MLDSLPAWARHLVILGISAVLYTVASAVVAANGASGLDWATLGTTALDAGAVAVATSGLLYLTKLTTQYGVGSDNAGE